MSLDCGWKPEYPERTCKLYTERPWPRFKPRTFLPWGDVANHRTIVLPGSCSYKVLLNAKKMYSPNFMLLFPVSCSIHSQRAQFALSEHRKFATVCERSSLYFGPRKRIHSMQQSQWNELIFFPLCFICWCVTCMALRGWVSENERGYGEDWCVFIEFNWGKKQIPCMCAHPWQINLIPLWV